MPSKEDLKTYANSTNHEGEGQNVLGADASVQFRNTPYCGPIDDNIYTALPKDYQGKAGDTAGFKRIKPSDDNDNILIPNREAELSKWRH